MSNFGQLRIYVSKKYFPIFHELTQSNLFTQNSEFLIFSTFIGEKHQRRSPLEGKHELCRAVTLSSYDLAAIKALYLQENNTLANVKDAIQLAEQYANGGVEYLIEHVLTDFIYVDEEGNWHLKQERLDDLQIKLFDFILTEKETVPF